LSEHSAGGGIQINSARIFALAGPAMLANITTPLLGVVATTVIGRLGDAAILGGVAMAALVFRLHVLAVRLFCAAARWRSPRRPSARATMTNSGRH